jgi:hypothetical protein
VRFKALVGGEIAGMVVVEVAHARPGLEQPHDIVAIGMQRDIQHRDLVAVARSDARQQPRAPLGSGHQLSRMKRLCKAELLQRAQAVRVAVEDENPPHA